MWNTHQIRQILPDNHGPAILLLPTSCNQDAWKPVQRNVLSADKIEYPPTSETVVLVGYNSVCMDSTAIMNRVRMSRGGQASQSSWKSDHRVWTLDQMGQTTLLSRSSESRYMDRKDCCNKIVGQRDRDWVEFHIATSILHPIYSKSNLARTEYTWYRKFSKTP